MLRVGFDYLIDPHFENFYEIRDLVAIRNFSLNRYRTRGANLDSAIRDFLNRIKRDIIMKENKKNQSGCIADDSLKNPKNLQFNESIFTNIDIADQESLQAAINNKINEFKASLSEKGVYIYDGKIDNRTDEEVERRIREMCRNVPILKKDAKNYEFNSNLNAFDSRILMSKLHLSYRAGRIREKKPALSNAEIYLHFSRLYTIEEKLLQKKNLIKLKHCREEKNTNFIKGLIGWLERKAKGREVEVREGF